ncbi:MAG TPA: GNAT family N-acetyltransferase [Chloroflexia bacterium]|nr:GNAT family N-acetyltransferase [Chloroflexia bacterium]
MTPIHVGRQPLDDPHELELRPFEAGTDDYLALARVRNETLRATTLPEDYRDMSAAEMQQYYYRADFDLSANAWLMRHRGEPVAGAVVYPSVIFTDRPPGNFDMYVVPDYWRHGIGSRLLAHLEQAAMERGHRVLETTVAEEDEQSKGFLSRKGFAVVSHALHLVRRGMDDLPEAQLASGYAIRSLAELREPPELYMDTANRLGAYDSNYTLVRAEELERTVAGEGWDPAGVLFLFDGRERIVGVIRASASRVGPEASAAGRRGYLHEIRLEPSSRGQGLGTAMVAVALRYLREAGVTRVELDTAGENTAAQGLAVRAGFELARHWLHFLKRLV